MRTYRSFLSCSFDKKDDEVVNNFVRIIKGLGIEPEIYNYPELGRLPERIKEHISRSDCLIAIATKRKKLEGSDSWECPDWIQNEMTLAFAYMKPIALFVEEGVEIKGLTSMEENRQMFSRDNLLQNVEQIIRYLCNLKETLELTKSYNPVLVRDYLHLEETFLKESVTQRCEVSMGSLVEELEATHHLEELDEKTPGLSIKPIEFSFKSLESPQGTCVGHTVVQDSDYKHLWHVTFTPPLTTGQKVKYAFKVVRPNIRPYTLEELMDRISRGTYKYKEPVCEACEWNIAYPTTEFRFRIDFPERYEISNCHVDVKMGEAGLKAGHELKRIREGNMFIAEKMFDKWSLRLEIPGPLQDYTYYIFYVPPAKDK